MKEAVEAAEAVAPVATRAQKIAELDKQILALQRAEEALVVASGAARSANVDAEIVLGVEIETKAAQAA